jgi:isoleucyl-tRNA synthetase
MEYKVLEDPEDIGLEKVFDTHAATLEKALRRPMDKHETVHVDGHIPAEKQKDVIIEEEQEIQKATFLLRLLKL